MRLQDASGLGSVGNLSRLNWILVSTAGDINLREYDMLFIRPGSWWGLADISLMATSPTKGLPLTDLTVMLPPVACELVFLKA